jgi:hypothetical protein
MKTFKDLVFKPHFIHEDGIISRLEFENGYGVSVVRHEASYGYDRGLYEMAVLKDGDIHYDNPIANGNVVGWLREEDVSDAMMIIQKW